MKNLDLDYTKQIVHLLKYYYPNNLNYIFVFELPWILTGIYNNIIILSINCDSIYNCFLFFISAAFNIIKALLPPKAVAALRFVNTKNISEYITEENMLTCWGGKDDYQFKFVPEQIKDKDSIYENITKDENGNRTIVNNDKKVCSFFFFRFIRFIIRLKLIPNSMQTYHTYSAKTNLYIERLFFCKSLMDKFSTPQE